MSIWKKYKSFNYYGFKVYDIKQGKIDVDYWEFKIQRPDGKIKRKTRWSRNITSFKRDIKIDIKSGEFGKINVKVRKWRKWYDLA